MRKKKRRKADIIVPIASMGDIAFLLIIFFLLCSRFAQQGIQVEPPESPDADEIQENQISVLIDEDGNIYFQGREVNGANDVEWGVRAMVDGKTEEKQKLVMFRCDRKVPKEKFEPIMEAIAKGGGLVAAVGDVGDVVQAPAQ